MGKEIKKEVEKENKKIEKEEKSDADNVINKTGNVNFTEA